MSWKKNTIYLLKSDSAIIVVKQRYMGFMSSLEKLTSDRSNCSKVKGIKSSHANIIVKMETYPDSSNPICHDNIYNLKGSCGTIEQYYNNEINDKYKWQRNAREKGK